MDKYRHPGDCFVQRENDWALGEVAVLMDCDGETVHRFPAAWTDEQIMHALDFANKAYAKGLEFGKWAKAREIRKCLMTEDTQ
jgi:hypothetical protein